MCIRHVGAINKQGGSLSSQHCLEQTFHHQTFHHRSVTHPAPDKLANTGDGFRWHCTKSSDCQVRVRGAPSNLYGVNVTKAVIGAYVTVVTCADTLTSTLHRGTDFPFQIFPLRNF